MVPCSVGRGDDLFQSKGVRVKEATVCPQKGNDLTCRNRECRQKKDCGRQDFPPVGLCVSEQVNFPNISLLLPVRGPFTLYGPLLSARSNKREWSVEENVF